jgi:hypothetical protein
VQLVHAPTVFNDELGYTKLALSLGSEGRLAVLGNEGFSYSPLYPVLLAPIYALGASVPTAYALVKIVNAVLISLAIFPIYKIARFALPRRDSLIVVGLAAVAPVMAFPAFTMSENLAYPLCLAALWALLAAVQRPSAGRDALLLLAIVAATATRIQLIVLVPAALTAVLLAAVAGREPGHMRRLGHAFRAHWLLYGAAAMAVALAGVRALAGGDVAAAFGRYSDVWRAGLPDSGHTLVLVFHHLAELDLAVGVIPFAGTLVAALGFALTGFPRRYAPFAAVAASFTSWLIIEVAIDAALFEYPGSGREALHERFLIYVVPLFLVACVASVRSARPGRLVYAGAGIAALLPGLIPFGTYVRNSNVIDTFALLPFGRSMGEDFVAVRFAPLIALCASAVLALIYARLGRRSLRSAAAVLAALSAFVWIHVEKSSATSRDALPTSTDWVDRETPTDDVILITAGQKDAMPALQTAFHSRSITRVYALCWQVFGRDGGERRISIGRSGALLDSGEPIIASFAVVPADFRVQGPIVARNAQGRQLLVKPVGSRLVLPTNAHVPGCGG